MKKYFTSESVSAGHPDKLADQISDAILDEYLIRDPYVKAGIETMIKDNIVILGGEISTSYKESLNIEKIVKHVIKTAGYTKEKYLDPESIKIINLLGKQSLEINKAVVKEDGELGAGDQGIMFGYACNEAPNYMSLDIYIAKSLLDEILTIDGLGPDAKSQVTIFKDNRDIKYIDNILLSTVHDSNINLYELRLLINDYIDTFFNKYNLQNYLMPHTKIIVNPAGEWHIGGSVSDCGLTGRKIVVDAYGGNCPVGGGAFSGKDSSKVDRSAAYLCRYIAKNIVAANILDECKIQLSYMIGVPEPSSINISGKINSTDINFNENQINLIKEIFPMTPKQIIDKFDLRKPIFYNTARYGHFGIDSYPWEQLDKVEELKNLF